MQVQTMATANTLIESLRRNLIKHWIIITRALCIWLNSIRQKNISQMLFSLVLWTQSTAISDFAINKNKPHTKSVFK